MNWKEITPFLYENIKPTKGSLGSIVDGSSAKRNKFSNLWIEFKMNSFIYNDPFYGEQKSTSMFNMQINLIDVQEIYEIGPIHKLQGLEIKDDSKTKIGAFSNSLHFTVPRMKFGQISKNIIPFEMEYCLTNSESYGMMSGTIDEHHTLTGTITQDLEIRNLIVLNSNKNPLNLILNELDKNIYDIKSAVEALDTNISYPDRTQYYVSYKNIVPVSKKRWWKR